ncbi:hypothetical protein [Robertkochia flava]|uniref:hypothetical protein n=1 Tax=Robertkochia flava TaxID=3447986 RepID=UPI001CCE0F65|nr:hypothetical protein [Robertkochia marina]
MFRIKVFTAIAVLLSIVQPLEAQEAEVEITPAIKARLERLEEARERMIEEERSLLKEKVAEIDQMVEDGQLTPEEAKVKKEEAARNTARNIENRTAILDNKIALVKRGEFVGTSDGFLKIDIREEEDWLQIVGFDECFPCSGPKRYDRRTTSDLVLAAGFNNVIPEGGSLDDSPYRIGGSKFFEIGWQFKTRVFRESNWLRLVYGLNFQFNGFKPEDDNYFVRDGDLTVLEPFPGNLDKSKLRMDNIVIPVYFEMGPSKRIDRDDYFRYSTRRKFRVGLGGYFGLNYSTRQKLKYKIDGDRSKDKLKNNYNTSNTIYGLAGYVGFGDLTLYTRYELNTLFKDPNPDQHNIAFGLRLEL